MEATTITAQQLLEAFTLDNTLSLPETYPYQTRRWDDSVLQTSPYVHQLWRDIDSFRDRSRGHVLWRGPVVDGCGNQKGSYLAFKVVKYKMPRDCTHRDMNLIYLFNNMGEMTGFALENSRGSKTWNMNTLADVGAWTNAAIRLFGEMEPYLLSQIKAMFHKESVEVMPGEHVTRAGMASPALNTLRMERREDS